MARYLLALSWWLFLARLPVNPNIVSMKYILRFTIHLFILFVPVILLGQGTYYNSINSASSSFITDLESRIRTPYTRITYDNYKTTIVPNFESRDTTSSRKVITCIYSGAQLCLHSAFCLDWFGGCEFRFRIQQGTYVVSKLDADGKRIRIYKFTRIFRSASSFSGQSK